MPAPVMVIAQSGSSQSDNILDRQQGMCGCITSGTFAASPKNSFGNAIPPWAQIST